MKTLIQIKDLRKTYGTRALLEGATAAFGDRQKIGVIGRNGAGKSTLFRILAGEEEADGGEIIRSRDLRMAYLEQKDPFRDDESVMDFLIRYTGREIWECGRVAGKFLIKGDLLNTPVRSLAGGFQMRIKLSAMLLAEPNFLMLDEPTNYLDLNTLLLLERMLSGWNGGFLVISHDREFLKRTCDHTLEVELGQVNLFPGNVEEYLFFKDEEKERTLSRQKNQEAKEKAIQEFIDRFRAKSSKASQAQSRVKLLEKMEKIEVTGPPPGVKIRIPRVPEKKSLALELRDLSTGYEERPITSGIRMELERGERVAVLGENGQGKTTLLRTLADQLKPLSGEIKWGVQTRRGYYAQHVYTTLDSGDTVLEALEKAASPEVTRQEIQDMAGAFLFQGDDSKKPVRVLSGGERARLSLAGILLSGVDVLLLDEPTNHLDFETVEALGNALRDFNGTVLFVSHDRTFVNLTATKILELADGKAEFFPGSYEEYVFRLETRLADSSGETNSTYGPSAKRDSGNVDSSSESSAKSDGSSSRGDSGNGGEELSGGGDRHRRRKEIRSELSRLEKSIDKQSRLVEELTKTRDRLLDAIQNDPGSGVRNLTDELNETVQKLIEEESAWLELEEKKDSLESEQESLSG